MSLSRAPKLLPALLACALYAWCALVASTPASAQIFAPDCLTVLEACQVCVQRNGQVDIRRCGQRPPTTDPEDDVPAELLQEPETADLEGLQKAIAERILAHWDVLHAVFGDPNRIYLPREVFGLAGRYPGATVDKIMRAAAIRFQSSLIAKSSRARVDRVPSGDGGEKFVIRTTDPLLAFVLRLLTDAGAFADVDLEDYVSSKRGLARESIQLEVDELFELFELSLRMDDQNSGPLP